MTEKITVTINGDEYEVEPGVTVLDACRKNDIFIPTLCEIDYIKEPFGGCRVCQSKIETERGTEVTTSCDTPVQEGMKITTDTEEVKESRKMALELLLSEHTGDCVAPCSLECPASMDPQGYLAHIANGRPHEAAKLIKESSPLAISLGRVCFAPCEDDCRRELVEDSLAIRQLKMYAAEKDMEGDSWKPSISEDSGKSVAIVGGGAAGLTAAFFLRVEGHDVKIFDKMPELGGMMRYGIPDYRLPGELLDKEIEWILDLGIEVETGAEMGVDFSLEELREDYDAVFVAIGAWESWIIPIEGNDLPGVMGGIDFLIDHSLGKDLDLGEKVVVVGGGNTAMDVARTVKRLGKDVTIAYRRTEEQAPANDEEIEEAKEEGVEFDFLLSPEEVCGSEEGIDRVKCSRMELGEPDESGRPRPEKIPGEFSELEADSVILAIGQSPDFELLEEEGLEVEEKSLDVDDTFRASFENVFTAGDALMGPSSVVESSGQAREVAFAIDAYLRGELENYEIPEDYEMPYGYVHEDEVTEEDLDYTDKPRKPMPSLSPEERSNNFDPIEAGFEDGTAKEEAKRCIECGCLDRYECLLREYSDLVDAEQEKYGGFKETYCVDDSYERVVREPNKCILCGSCVRTTEESHGEGVVQFANRGLETVVEPAFGYSLDKVDSKLKGDLADACPTGALEEVIADEKPGPHRTDLAGRTYCIGCGLTCPVEVRTVNGRPVMLKPRSEGHYESHLCDIGKFDTLIDESDRPEFEKGVFEELESILTQEEVDILFSEKITLEEFEELENLAKVLDGELVSHQKVSRKSNVGIEDLLSCDEYFVEDGVFDVCPLLKHFVKRAEDEGAEKVEEFTDLDSGVALLLEGSEKEADKRIIAHSEPNTQGVNIGSSEEISGGTLIVYGGGIEKVPEADDIIQFTPEENDLSQKADLVVPIRNWLEREGEMINSFEKSVYLTPVIGSDLPRNVEIIQKIEEIVK